MKWYPLDLLPFVQKAHPQTFLINQSYIVSLLAVCLQDSVLAFWKHGMQGKSFKSDEVSLGKSVVDHCFAILLTIQLGRCQSQTKES